MDLHSKTFVMYIKYDLMNNCNKQHNEISFQSKDINNLKVIAEVTIIATRLEWSPLKKKTNRVTR